MKHFLFLSLITMAGALGAVVDVFWALLLYYALAVLRPQYLWAWSLPADLRWSLVAAVLVIAGVALHWTRLLRQAHFTGIFWMMLSYACIVMLSCLTAFDPETAQRWAIEYGKIFLIALLACIIIRHIWHVQLLALVILACLGYTAWEVNSLYFFDGRLDIYHYGLGGLDNNGAGLAMAMGLPFAYALGVSGTKGWQRALGGVLALLLLHAVLMSFSRGAMLASLAGGIWLVLHHRPRWQAPVFLIAAILAVSVLAGQEIRDRFASSGEYRTDASAQLRFESWNAAWSMAWENPILGKGIRNADKLSFNYGADNQGRTIHSLYLQIAADSGIPAMALYIALLLAAVWNYRSVRQRCLQPDYGPAPNGSRDGPVHKAQSPALSAQLHQTAAIALACQTSLLIFAMGAMFLSVEVVELPWLLIAMGGVLPVVLERHLRSAQRKSDPMPSKDEAPAEPATPAARRPRSKRLRPSPVEALATPVRWSDRETTPLPLSALKGAQHL